MAGKPAPEATAMARSGVRPPWRAALGFVGWLGLVLLLLLEPAAPAAAAIVPVSSGNAAGPNVGAASPWNLQVNLNVPGNTTVVVAVAVKNTAVIYALGRPRQRTRVGAKPIAAGKRVTGIR